MDVNKVFEEALNRAMQELEIKVARDLVGIFARKSATVGDLVSLTGEDPRLKSALMSLPLCELSNSGAPVSAATKPERKSTERKPAKVHAEVKAEILAVLAQHDGPVPMVSLVRACGTHGEAKVRAALLGAIAEGAVKMLGDRRTAKYALVKRTVAAMAICSDIIGTCIDAIKPAVEPVAPVGE